MLLMVLPGMSSIEAFGSFFTLTFGSLYLKKTGSLKSSVMPGRHISSKQGWSFLSYSVFVFMKFSKTLMSAGVTAIYLLFLNILTTVWSKNNIP